MKLMNGRGQLGEYLKLSKYKNDNIEIYHTWNFLDKSESTQKKEYNKFVSYLEAINPSKKIIFISTMSNDSTYYKKYKTLCENLVLLKSKNNLVIRLPNLIGKGIFLKLKNNEVTPQGVIQFLTIKEACDFIIDSIERVGIIEPETWKASAEAILTIMNYDNKL